MKHHRSDCSFDEDRLLVCSQCHDVPQPVEHYRTMPDVNAVRDARVRPPLKFIEPGSIKPEDL
jgi:hypothetical protein